MRLPQRMNHRAKSKQVVKPWNRNWMHVQEVASLEANGGPLLCLAPQTPAAATHCTHPRGPQCVCSLLLPTEATHVEQSRLQTYAPKDTKSPSPCHVLHEQQNEPMSCLDTTQALAQVSDPASLSGMSFCKRNIDSQAADQNSVPLIMINFSLVLT